ncbi:MAG: polysaccharide biosynthesis protein [Oscillospiraceae bacterium]|nr:polysaccharide biosynthesis protein [Oscillospiraceae bacterium]
MPSPGITKKAPGEQNYLRGALYLSIAMMITKLIGALYKLPIQNLLTEEGGGLYAVSYQLYTILYILAIAGLPVAISKMISESETSRAGESRRILNVARIIFFIIGAAGSLFMLLGAEKIAWLMNAPGAAWGIRAVAPSVFLVGFISPYRGFYQGKKNMIPTAVSEVLEALGKLVFGVGAAYLALHLFIPSDNTEATQALRDSIGAAAAISGVSVGMIISAVYLKLSWKKHGVKSNGTENRGARRRGRREIARQMLRLSLPVMLCSSALSLTNFIDLTMIRNLLVSHAGFIESEMNRYMGAYSYAVNLFNLPVSFIAALGISLLPAITSFKVQGDNQGIQNTVGSAMRVTCILAMPAGVGLVALANPILSLLYHTKVATGGVAIAVPLLQILGFAVVFACIVTVTNSMLQALGLIWVPLVTMAIGCLCKIVCTFVLAANPEINIRGGPIGTLICYGIIAILNLTVIAFRTRIRRLILKNLGKTLFAAVAMGAVAFGGFQFWSYFLETYLNIVNNGAISAVMAVFMAGMSYFILLLLIGGLSKQELDLLPGGKKIALLLKIR